MMEEGQAVFPALIGGVGDELQTAQGAGVLLEERLVVVSLQQEHAVPARSKFPGNVHNALLGNGSGGGGGKGRGYGRAR